MSSICWLLQTTQWFFTMAALLLAAVSIICHSPDAVRAVVQEGRPFVLAVDAVDGDEAARVAICVEGKRSYRPSNLVHCVDLRSMQIRFAKEFPEAIRHAAIAPGGDWAVVSGDSKTWRFNMKSGAATLLFADVAGLVAIDSEGALIAVAMNNHRGFSRIDPADNLRVYDLEKEMWKVTHNSGIVQFADLAFAGKKVLTIGLGGAVYSRARRAYFGAVTLDVESGKASLKKSETPYDYNDDPPRLTPAEIKKVRAKETAAQQKITDWKEFDASGHGLGDTEFFGVKERDGQMHVVLNRWAGGQSGGVWSGFHFQLKPNGEVSHRSFDNAMRLQQIGDDMVAVRYADENYEAENFFSGAKFEIPRMKGSDSRKFWSQNTHAGLLVQDQAELQLFRPTEKPSAWTKPTDVELAQAYAVSSTDGRFIAIAAHGASKIEVRNGDTGEVIKQLPFKKDKGTYLLAMAFSPDGNQLAVKESHLQVFSTETFEIIAEEKVEEKAYYWHVSWVDGGWLLGGASESVLFHGMRGWGTRFAISEAFRAEPIIVNGEKCLLLETRYGTAYIANASSGKIIQQWSIRKYHSTSGRIRLPPAAKVFFDGKLLVRQIGSTGRFVLTRTSDLTTIATIAPIPQGRGVIGWVLTTPDGRWAASKEVEAKIEDRLVVYRNNEPLSVAAMQEYKIDDLKTILPK